MLSKNRIKFIQNLGQKKERMAAGQFVAEGEKIVEEILTQQPQRIVEIFALNSWLSQIEIPHYITTSAVDEAMLQRLSTLSTPNKAIALVQMQQAAALPTANHTQWILMLDNIQNPGNLGTIIRLADWYGIQHIICSPHTVDYTNAKVLQATMGSFLNVQVHYTELIEYVQQHSSIYSYAATLQGESLHQVQIPKGGILVIGNESKGINPKLIAACSHQVTIPKYGSAESLNAGVATGILLSHFIH